MLIAVAGTVIDPVQLVTIRLRPRRHGLLPCRDVDSGDDWTLVTEDLDYLHGLTEQSGEQRSIDPSKFLLSAPWWPAEW